MSQAVMIGRLYSKEIFLADLVSAARREVLLRRLRLDLPYALVSHLSSNRSEAASIVMLEPQQ